MPDATPSQHESTHLPHLDQAQAPVVEKKQPVEVRVSLRLPEKLHDLYAERAAKFGRTTEEELIDRLTKCQTHTATHGIYFDDDARAKLAQMSGHLITSSSDLMAKLRNLLDLRVGKVMVELPEPLVARLKTRCYRGQTLGDLLKKQVREDLERFCGLR